MRNLIPLLVAMMMLVARPVGADRLDDNLEQMVSAARTLTLSEAEGKAVLLEKMETIRSPVAVVFGYADNAAACAEMATALSASGTVGSFQCSPIY